MNLILIILGKPHHGKSEVRRSLEAYTGYRGHGTSDMIFRDVAEECASYTPGLSADRAEAMLRRADKDSIRPILVARGNRMCSEDPAALVRKCVDCGARIIDGVRRSTELHMARKALVEAGNVVQVWWVERNPPPPPVEDNTEVTSADADVVIENNGDLQELRETVFKKWRAFVTSSYGTRR